MSRPPRALVLSGPTAVGKTELIPRLTQVHPCAVVSIDSRQIYRGMRIGSAQPDAEALRALPHYGIDLRDPDSPWTAGEAARDAHRWIDQAWTSGRLPIVTGGSGLYLQAVLGGLDVNRRPPAVELRATLETRLEREGLASLATELAGRDPETAAAIDLNNPRRVLRALELLAQGAAAGGDLRQRSLRLAGPRLLLTRPRQDLVRRIDARVDAMFAAGLVEETRALLARWGEVCLSKLPTLGYDQVRAHLRGEQSLVEAQEQVKIATRRYAKRQMTWFRKFGELETVEITELGPALRTLEDRLREV